MRTYCTRLTVLLIIYTLVGCDHSKKKVDVKNHSVIAKVKSPCDNPKTVEELLAWAGTVGKVNLIRVGTGKDFNSGCDTSWNPEDTVLTVTYKDSLVLWRVNQKKGYFCKKNMVVGLRILVQRQLASPAGETKPLCFKLLSTRQFLMEYMRL